MKMNSLSGMFGKITYFNKIRPYFSLDREMRILLLEAYIFLMWARFIKLYPFSMVYKKLGSYSEETSTDPRSNNSINLIKISNAIHIMSRHTFWESSCMVKAIASMKMLNRRHIESTIYFGTGKDKNGTMIAHAWVRSGDVFITGAEEMSRFTVVGSFAKKFY
jgi:hypothetical protein